MSVSTPVRRDVEAADRAARARRRRGPLARLRSRLPRLDLRGASLRLRRLGIGCGDELP